MREDSCLTIPVDPDHAPNSPTRPIVLTPALLSDPAPSSTKNGTPPLDLSDDNDLVTRADTQAAFIDARATQNASSSTPANSNGVHDDSSTSESSNITGKQAIRLYFHSYSGAAQ